MEKIYSMFLRLMTDYKNLLFKEEELVDDFSEILEQALIETQLKRVMNDVEYSLHTKEFNRKLIPVEQYILAHTCVYIWLQPMVNSAELMSAQLTSTDFSQFSNSNRISAILRLYNNSLSKVNMLISEYDALVGMEKLNKKLGENHD